MPQDKNKNKGKKRSVTKTDIDKEFQSSRNFFKDYIKSPVYKERLLAMGYDNPEMVQENRLNRINSMRDPLIRPDAGGEYLRKERRMIIDPLEFDKEGTTLPSTVSHEMSHGISSMSPVNLNYPDETLNSNEVKLINKVNKAHSTWPEHDARAWELKSDMDALRYNLFKDKIYDTKSNRKFNTLDLKKAKEKYKDAGLQRLFNNVNDADLIYLMNNIAYNQSNNMNNIYAKHGTSMKKKSEYIKYQEGGDLLSGEPTPQETYYQASARLSHYKNILNDKLKAKNPEAFSNYFKGLVDLRRTGRTADAQKYVQDTQYNEYLSPEEVRTTLGENDYNDYLSSLRTVNTFDVSQGRQPLYGQTEGEKDITGLNYGRRFASLQITPGISVFNQSSGKKYQRNYQYNPTTRQVDYTESGDLSLTPSYVTKSSMDDGGVLSFKVPQIPIHTEMMNYPLDGLQRDSVNYYAQNGTSINNDGGKGGKGGKKRQQVEKDPNIKGPIGFLNSYFNSPAYKKRLRNFNSEKDARIEEENNRWAIDTYQPGIDLDSPISYTRAELKPHLNTIGRMGRLPTRPTGVFYNFDTSDPNMSREGKVDALSGVVPHEYSHWVRNINPKERRKIAGLNQMDYDYYIPGMGDDINLDSRDITGTFKTTDILNAFEKDYKPGSKEAENEISNYFYQYDHDALPDENYADLNALRWTLYNLGIYDTRKGDLKKEHLEKLFTDENRSKGNIPFNLWNLRAEFGDEALIELNNTIGMNYNSNSDKEPMAKSGIHINPKNKGKFTATKKRTGKTTEELTHSKNPLTRKRAIFAQNAKKWNKKDAGGLLGNIIDFTDKGEFSSLEEPINFNPLDDYNAEYVNIPDLANLSEEESEILTAKSGIYINPFKRGMFTKTAKWHKGQYGLTEPDPNDPQRTISDPRANNYMWDPLSTPVPTPFQQNNSGVIDTRNNQQYFTTDPNQSSAGFTNEEIIQDENNQQQNQYNWTGLIDNVLLGADYIANRLGGRPKSNKKPIQMSYNPYPQGTGSQAIMNYGGPAPKFPGKKRKNKLKANEGLNIQSGGTVSQISDPDQSNPIFKFNGNSHEQGGIKLDYNGQPVEVEGGETAFLDAGGNFNVFGNMKVPGTKMNFDTMGERLATKENKYKKAKMRGAKIVNEADLDSKNSYERYKFNAGKAMLESNEKSESDVAEEKENLVALQNAMLLTAETYNQDPKKMFKANKGASFGAYDPYKRIPYDASKPMPKDPYKANFPIAKFDNGGTNYLGAQPAYNYRDSIEEPFTRELFNSQASLIDKPPIHLDNGGGGIKEKFSKLQKQTEAALAKLYPGRKITVRPSYDRDISTQRGLQAAGRSKTPVSLHNLGAAGDYNIYVDGKLIQDPKVYQDTLWKEAKNLGLFTVGTWDPAHISAVEEGTGNTFSNLIAQNPDLRDSTQYTSTVNYLRELIANNQATNREISAFNQLTGGNVAIPRGRGYIDNTSPASLNVPQGQTLFGETLINQSLSDFPTIEGIREVDTSGVTRTPQTNITQFDPEVPEVPEFRIPQTRERSLIRNPLTIDQYLPEAYTIATGVEQPVQAQFYSPQLYQPYEMSFQDQRNQIQSAYNATAKQLVDAGRYDLLSSLASERYQAIESVTSGQEFRTNQAIANDTYNKNIGLLNQAELTNLQIADIQADRQAQAFANTQDRITDALVSLSSKSAQNRLETKTANLYSQLMNNFKYNEDSGKVEFDPESVTGDIFTSPTGTVTPSNINSKTTQYYYNDKGKRVGKTETEPQYKVQRERQRLFK